MLDRRAYRLRIGKLLRETQSIRCHTQSSDALETCHAYLSNTSSYQTIEGHANVREVDISLEKRTIPANAISS